MKLNDFKVLNESDTHYEVGHPNGKKMSVEKKGLSKRALETISSLKPHFDDGGMALVPDFATIDPAKAAAAVPTLPSVPESEMTTEQKMHKAIDSDPKMSSMWNTGDAAGAEQASIVPTSIPGVENTQNLPANDSAGFSQASAQPGTDPNSIEGMMGQKNLTMDQSLEQQKGFLNMGANAEEQQARADQGIYGNLEAKLAALPTPMDYTKKREEMDKQFEDKLTNNQIDPNKLWHDAGMGNKMAAGIGLILAGIGSGLTGQPNQAAAMINNKIERDIDAQKTNQSKTMTLWKMNREALGNDLAATLATQNQYYSVAKVQLSKAAATAADPQARARAGMLMSDISMKQAQNRQQLGMIQYATGSSQAAGGKPGGVPAPKPPPATQIYLLQKAGAMSDADAVSAAKELGQVQKMNKLRADVEQASQHLQGQFLNGTFNPNDRDSAINTFAGILAKEAEGRFNLEESKNQMAALMPMRTDGAETVANKAGRRAQFFTSMVEQPTLLKHHIDVPYSGPLQVGKPVR